MKPINFIRKINNLSLLPPKELPRKFLIIGE